MKHVLIFAYECSPYHFSGATSGAQRPTQIAKYLQEFGWRVIVICCDYQRRFQLNRSEIGHLKKEIKEKVENNDSWPLFIPTPSLPYDGLIDYLWRQTLVLDEKGMRYKTRNQFASIVRFPLTFLKFFKGDYSQSWQPCAKVAADEIVKQMDINICVGEYGPNAGLFLGKWFNKKYNVPWIADFRDPVLHPYKNVRQIYKPIARNLTSTAQAVVNVNPASRDIDAETLKKPAYCVTNGFDPDDFPGIDDDSGKEYYQKLRIGYMGAIRESLHNPELFFEALGDLKKNIPDVSNYLDFTYIGHDVNKVKKFSRKYDVNDMISLKGFMPRQKTLNELSKVDLLVLFSIANPEAQGPDFKGGNYPGKVFEFFGLKKPILLIPGDEGVLNKLINDTNTGVVLKNKEAIFNYLVNIIKRWQEGRKSLIPFNPSGVNHYSRKNQVAIFSSILNKYFKEN